MFARGETHRHIHTHGHIRR